MTVAEKDIEKIFIALELDIERQDEHWLIKPPTFRFDLSTEADLVEEIARVVGYERIPSSLPLGESRPAQTTVKTTLEVDARDCLIARGYFEAVTYSFVDPIMCEQLDPQRVGPKLTNPISSEMSMMRPSLWPGLISAAQHNLNRQQGDIRLFEIGMIFTLEGDQLNQTNKLGGLRCGPTTHEQWGEEPREIDFYDFKQDVMSLVRALHIEGIQVTAAEVPGLHPNCGVVLVNNTGEIGRFGALHPAITRDFGIGKTLYLLEINHEAGSTTTANPAQYRPISRFPVVRRDISIIVDESIPFSACLNAVQEVAGESLRDLELFDVYRGQGIDSDKKSFSLGLIFQAISSTLVDREVDEAVHRVVESLSRRVGGSLRE